MPQTRLSELECFVLGLIWREPGSAAYDVRRRLAESPSTQWSASAGAIYPLVARLERAGYVRGTARRTGKRARREHTITPKGLRALRAWIGPPLPPVAVTVTHDPLRSRARFLDALTPAQRRKWAACAMESLEEVERRMMAWHAAHEAGGDPSAALLRAHAALDLEFRRRWLRMFPKV